MQIKEAIDKCKEDRTLYNRHASFDYCYNYFYSFYKEKRLNDLANKDNLQLSCLQLGFYLASWGMMRGSSFLLEKSVKHYEPLIKDISEMDSSYWEIDVDKYDDKNIKKLMTCKDKIIKALGKKNNPSDTLVTKIMLGVFASTPAFDMYFKKFMGSMGKSQTFNEKALKDIKIIYENNIEYFNLLEPIPTFVFSSKEKSIIHTKAKLIDMYGWMQEKDKEDKKKKEKHKKEANS